MFPQVLSNPLCTDHSLVGCPRPVHLEGCSLPLCSLGPRGDRDTPDSHRGRQALPLGTTVSLPPASAWSRGGGLQVPSQRPQDRGLCSSQSDEVTVGLCALGERVAESDTAWAGSTLPGLGSPCADSQPQVTDAVAGVMVCAENLGRAVRRSERPLQVPGPGFCPEGPSGCVARSVSPAEV